jgi:hypothetical protein
MAETKLVLKPEERDYLVHLLESALGDARVELHHTHAAAYRERVHHSEDMIRALLSKLGVAPTLSLAEK